MKGIFTLVSLFFILFSINLKAETDWVTVTIDNDLFVGNDSGYTNGIYLSFFDVGDSKNEIPKHDFWVAPLMWSMPKNGTLGAVNSYMLGQTMSTPSDITVVIPDENELPYSALLALTNSYITVTPTYADRVSTSIGIVGPLALGEESQKLVHKIIGSDEPQGWDTQLENELVFQLSRGRTWRSWVSDSDNMDFLTSADLSVGTIQSSISAGITIRYGKDLINSYATTLLNNSRTSNPSAIKGAWYIYGGLQTGYVFNQIFTDGNTFRDSRSIDYDKQFVGLTFGIAYSWENTSFTFAINDSNIIQSGKEQKTLEDLTQYGTITLAWRM
jgi:hypothetical protein